MFPKTPYALSVVHARIRDFTIFVSSSLFILHLQNGETYSVSIIAIGQDFPSETVAAKDVGLGE